MREKIGQGHYLKITPCRVVNIFSLTLSHFTVDFLHIKQSKNILYSLRYLTNSDSLDIIGKEVIYI